MYFTRVAEAGIAKSMYFMRVAEACTAKKGMYFTRVAEAGAARILRGLPKLAQLETF